MNGCPKKNFRVWKLTNRRYFECLYTPSVIFKFIHLQITWARYSQTWLPGESLGSFLDTDSLALPKTCQVTIFSSKTQESIFLIISQYFITYNPSGWFCCKARFGKHWHKLAISFGKRLPLLIEWIELIEDLHVLWIYRRTQHSFLSYGAPCVVCY